MFSDKDISKQIGQRLAGSPTSTVSAPSMSSSVTSDSVKGNKSTDDSAVAQSFSSSMYEQSIVSNFDDDRRSLNEGFIMSEEKDGDITRIMSEPAIASHDSGEYVMLGDVMPRESLSDSTMMLNDSKLETPRGHSRSFSVDSTLNNSARKGSLKRGQPNSLRAGLLNGDQREVQKLRRSFGLDKSDIGFPVPVSVANVSDDDQYVQLDCSMDFLNTASTMSDPVSDPAPESSVVNDTSPGSVSRTKSSASLASNVTDKNEDDRETGYECDDESEAGFSTISGGTALFVPNDKLCSYANAEKDSGSIKFETDKENDSSVQKSLAQQKQESKDSLLSETSSIVSPVVNFKEREMTRSVSADSGKGSICDEMQDEGYSANVTLDSIASTVLDQKESPRQTSEIEPMDVEFATPKATGSGNMVLDDSLVEEDGPSTIKKAKTSLAQKSVSSNDLQRDCEQTPSKVSRSKSLLETSMTKKMNMKPNLQISAETHKLLARAGYIKEPKAPEKSSDFNDFAVPGSFPFIKQAECLNPRRESIIALQKNNAGHVRNNIKQFDKITQQSDVDRRKVSPLRFPNSTSRRMRNPPPFIKSGKDIDVIKFCLQSSKDKLQIGTARVPISTNIVKPSDPENTICEEKPTGLKRKPSIYYAEKDGVKKPPFKVRNTAHVDSAVENDSTLEDEVFMSAEKHQAFCGKLPELNESLQETINDVCTPLSEKIRLNVNSDKIDRRNKENKYSDIDGSKMPEIKPSVLTTPVSIDTVHLRTASNKTPVELFKTNKSPRSPIKPLKRLGSSPHSPRNRVMHSPKLVKNNRRSLLSTIPNQSEELNNL